MSNNYSDNNVTVFGWDDEIKNDGQDFILLEPGDYDFEVTSFERSRFDGSEKIPPCNMAIINLRVIDKKSGLPVNLRENLILCSNMEWKISSFFGAIGQKKKGEPVRMNWQAVPGAKGRLEVTHRTYTSNGEEKVTNSVKKFYYKEDAPQAQQPAFTPGSF